MKKMLVKSALGTVLSVAMIAGQSIPALAGTTNGTAATGNLLDYSVTTVVTPTTIQIALNPNEYNITTKYVLTSGAYDSNKTYYTEADGVYTKADITAFASNTKYYEMVTSDAQVVSMNYGIANKSTEAQTVTVEIRANYTASTEEGKKPIELVGTAAEATAVSETNENGAAKGDLKMFLAIASATALPTANTYAKATAYTANTVYYSRSEAGVYSEASTQPTSTTKDFTGLYVSTTTIGPEITAAELSDVTMTAATSGDGFIAFEADDTYKGVAKIGYALDESEFSLKDGEVINFSTTQEQLASKLEMSALGGVAAFTITGALNKDANWTIADTAAITFTPIYTFEEASGEEEAIANAGYNQISIVPADVAPSATATQAVLEADKVANITVDLGSGSLAATEVAGFTSVAWGNEWISGGYATYSDGVITITDIASVNAIINESNADARKFTITFDDEDETTVEVTLTVKE
jgi:hypothetical protein